MTIITIIYGKFAGELLRPVTIEVDIPSDKAPTEISEDLFIALDAPQKASLMLTPLLDRLRFTSNWKMARSSLSQRRTRRKISRLAIEFTTEPRTP